MDSEEKTLWVALGVGVVVFLSSSVLSIRYGLGGWMEFFLFLMGYLLLGYPVFQRVVEHIQKRDYVNEYLLLLVATVGAMGIGAYIEANIVMLIFVAAGFVEQRTVRRSTKYIQEFMDLRPLTAVRKIKGKEVQVEPSELKLRHIVVVKPGEKIPVDGVVTAGATTLDMQALTGETIPQTVYVGDKVYGGSINLTGAIEFRVTRLYQDSTVARIMKLVEESAEAQERRNTPVRRFMHWYTIAMLVITVGIAVIPPMTFAWSQWHDWIYRGIVFSVAACPCGLLISEPLAFLGGVAAASRHGVIVKGGACLEALAQADTFVFDKTGTLTEGEFEIVEVCPTDPDKIGREELLKYAAYAESYSNHPLAKSIRKAYEGPIEKKLIKSVKEQPGYGISATIDGVRVHIGNQKMAAKQKVDYDRTERTGTVIHIVINKEYAGYLVAEDKIRSEAYDLMKWLRERKNAMLVMLTGDRKDVAKKVAEELDMDYAYANLLPEQKMEHLEDLLGLEREHEKVVYIGDGINDAPVLAKADIGIAMGVLGSDAAIDAADVVLMDDDLDRIGSLVNLSEETVHVVQRNLSFACLVKFFVLALCVPGLIGIWNALAADMVVMFTALLNACLIVKYPID